MSGVGIIIVGTMVSEGESKQVTITGIAGIPGLEVGGGPMPGGPPPKPWGPINYPDQSLPGNQPYPDQSLPGNQPYPGQGLPPGPSHPIVLPPQPTQPPEPPTEGKPPPPGGGWGWSPEYGWGYFPPSGGKPQPQ